MEGSTTIQKFKEWSPKQKLKLYKEYKEHKRNSNKAIQPCFDESLLINLETDGMVLGVTPMEVFQHMCDNFLLKVDKDQEILKTREVLEVDYDPDRIVQHYYKNISNARQLLTALKETDTEAEIMRNAFAIFKQQIDLKEACREWTRGSGTTWVDMKKHFSKEIQMNKTDPAIMKQKEVANAVLDQTKEREENQQQTMEVAVLQTKKIAELEEKIEYQLANSTTNSGNSISGRIPATIDTINSGSTSGGGSTNSTVTKEEMMQMFTQFQKSLQQGQCTEITTPAPKGKEKSKFGTNYILNDLGNGQRSKRRYPDSTSYCSLCGYDIKPTHTSGTCTNRKTNHNEAATITNKLGGVTTNCHFAE